MIHAHVSLTHLPGMGSNSRIRLIHLFLVVLMKSEMHVSLGEFQTLKIRKKKKKKKNVKPARQTSSLSYNQLNIIGLSVQW